MPTDSMSEEHPRARVEISYFKAGNGDMFIVRAGLTSQYSNFDNSVSFVRQIHNFNPLRMEDVYIAHSVPTEYRIKLLKQLFS